MSTGLKRKIVQIDPDKCDGCGLCVPNCAEGAIRIIEGKARLVSDLYCDGLGACLGHCPQGAITIIEREAEPFSEAAVEAARPVATPAVFSGCPGSRAQSFQRSPAAAKPAGAAPSGEESCLGQWPVQLSLVSPAAPYFQGAHLLVTADCVPFAYAGYHRDFLAGKAVVVGCPKLDDLSFYVDKLTAIFSSSHIRAVTVLHLEVPCCHGLVMAVKEALARSGKQIPQEVVTIGIRGDIISRTRTEIAPAAH